MRRLQTPPRGESRFDRLRASFTAFVVRVSSGPRKLLQAVGARLALVNPRARRRVREASAALMALAHALQAEYTASGAIVFSLVYQLEAAQTALANAMEAALPPGDQSRPDTDLTRMATALLEVVHLAQLTREWQQDVINLQHSLATNQLTGGQRAGLEDGVRHLQGYVQQNMHDLDRWLQAAEKLNPAARRAAAELRKRSAHRF